MRSCPTCGSQFSGDERFCSGDGSRLLQGSPDRATAPPGEDPLLGVVLDRRYRLDKKIGAGGMGAVYRGRHLLMDRAVAIKVLRAEVAAEPHAARRFRREAQQSSLLDHPHIVRVTDFGEAEGGLLFLVMEYLAGRTVGQELHCEGPFAWQRVAHLCRQVASALAHAHSLQMVHRDLKPDNIMLTSRDGDSDHAKVLDFGLAKLLEREQGASSDTRWSIGSLTETGLVFGTPEYMSPEQASGNPIDLRTDIYSLGVLAYQMVTGSLPFTAASFMEILSKHVAEEPVPPAVRRPDLAIPLAIDRLILRCMAKEPGERPQSASQVSELFEKHGAETGPNRGRLAPDHCVKAGAEEPPAAPTVPLVRPVEKLSSDQQTAARIGSGTPRSRWRMPLLSASAVLIGTLLITAWMVFAGGIEDSELDASMVMLREPVAGPDHSAATPGGSQLSISDAPSNLPTVDASPHQPGATGQTESRRPPLSAGSSADQATSAQVKAHLAAAQRARAAGDRELQAEQARRAYRLAPGDSYAGWLIGDALIANGNLANGCKYLYLARQRKQARVLYKSAGCDVH